MPFPIGALAAPLVGAASSAILGKLFGGGGSKGPSKAQSAAAKEELALLQRRNRLSADLERLRMRPSAAAGILSNTDGQGFQFGTLGEKSNAPDLLSAIDFDTLRQETRGDEIIRGLGGGTSQIGQQASNQANLDFQRSNQIGGIGKTIAQILLEENVFGKKTPSSIPTEDLGIPPGLFDTPDFTTLDLTRPA